MGIEIIQGSLSYPHHRKWPQEQWSRKTEDLSQKECRNFFVFRGDNGVFQFYGNDLDPFF
jgi:hypothetical protein